jgi:hypothetical protein
VPSSLELMVLSLSCVEEGECPLELSDLSLGKWISQSSESQTHRNELYLHMRSAMMTCPIRAPRKRKRAHVTRAPHKALVHARKRARAPMQNVRASRKRSLTLNESRDGPDPLAVRGGNPGIRESGNPGIRESAGPFCKARTRAGNLFSISSFFAPSRPTGRRASWSLIAGCVKVCG